MKKDVKPDTFAVINNYNFYDRHTDRRTWRLYDRPGPEDRVGENQANRDIQKISVHHNFIKGKSKKRGTSKCCHRTFLGDTFNSSLSLCFIRPSDTLFLPERNVQQFLLCSKTLKSYLRSNDVILYSLSKYQENVACLVEHTCIYN